MCEEVGAEGQNLPDGLWVHMKEKCWPSLPEVPTDRRLRCWQGLHVYSWLYQA